MGIKTVITAAAAVGAVAGAGVASLYNHFSNKKNDEIVIETVVTDTVTDAMDDQTTTDVAEEA